MIPVSLHGMHLNAAPTNCNAAASRTDIRKPSETNNVQSHTRNFKRREKKQSQTTIYGFVFERNYTDKYSVKLNCMCLYDLFELKLRGSY